MRVPCSPLRYHCAVKSIKAGLIEDSNTPRKLGYQDPVASGATHNRHTKSCLKLLQAAIAATQVPQMMMLNDVNFASGSRCWR